MSLINKAFALIYMWIIKETRKDKNIDSNAYLIIVPGHMGNAIMCVDALKKMSDYCMQKNKKAYIACTPYIWKALCSLEDMSGYKFLNGVLLDNGKFTCKNLRRMHKKMAGMSFDKVITTLSNHNVCHFLAVTTPCNESWCVTDEVSRPLSLKNLGYVTMEHSYTNLLKVPIDMHEMQRYKLLFTQIGVPEYDVKIHSIETKQDIEKPQNTYITIALDSMNSKRRWELEKFSLLVIELLNKYNFDICLTGVSINKTIFDNFFNKLLKNKRVYNYIGRTSFQQWLSLLKNAVFHIGVDSGSIHFAAAVGTQSFCLTGVWDGHRCFPYCLDKIDENTKSPICIYRSDIDINKLECYACKVKGLDFGFSNRNCNKDCDIGLPCKCLQELKVEDVLKIIDEYIQAERLG